MNLLDKVILEWAYKCEKGYPDLNNSKDLAIFESMFGIKLQEEEKEVMVSIEDIIKILPSIQNDSEALTHIEKYIKNRPGQNKFFEYLKSKNINDKTLGSGSAPELIFNVLFKNDFLEDFMKYIENPIKFSSLGTSGNFTSILSNIFSNNIVNELIQLGGSEEGRGVGKGELFLATIFEDLKMKDGKGDIDWNGKYLEVKGTGARLGKRGSSLLGSTPLIELFEKHNIPKLDSLSKTIPMLLEFEDKNTVFKELKDTLNKLYENSSVNKYLVLESLNNSNTLRISLQKVYASSYIKSEGADHIVFIDTTGSTNFYSFNEEQLVTYIEENSTKFSSPISLKNLAPQVFSKGIK